MRKLVRRDALARRQCPLPCPPLQNSHLSPRHPKRAADHHYPLQERWRARAILQQTLARIGCHPQETRPISPTADSRALLPGGAVPTEVPSRNPLVVAVRSGLLCAALPGWQVTGKPVTPFPEEKKVDLQVRLTCVRPSMLIVIVTGILL